MLMAKIPYYKKCFDVYTKLLIVPIILLGPQVLDLRSLSLKPEEVWISKMNTV